jgi:hypothetical protein
VLALKTCHITSIKGLVPPQKQNTLVEEDKEVKWCAVIIVFITITVYSLREMPQKQQRESTKLCRGLVQVIVSLLSYYSSLHLPQIDDTALVHEITSHTNEQLFKINFEYQKKYEKTLVEAIKGDTSGDYRDLLGM